MRFPDTAYTTRPWRIHEITPGFRRARADKRTAHAELGWRIPEPGSERFSA